MDPLLLRALVDEFKARRRAALVTVVETKGSVPRHIGSAMLVRADGSIFGTVGGGAGEAKAREAGLRALAEGRPALIKIEMLGAEALGSDMICGGTSRMLVEVVEASGPWTALLEAAGRGERSLLVRALLPEGGRRKGGAPEGLDPSPFALDENLELRAGVARPLDESLAREALRTGRPLQAAEGELFLDPLLPRERLLILGAGHVGAALAPLASILGFTVTVADDRPEYLAPGTFPPEIKTQIGDIAEIIAGFGCDASTYIVIATRGHLHDLEAVRAAFPLKSRYLGFIGSARKTRLILEQLKSEGCDPLRVEALRAPIGLDIGAETPEELAVSILGELVAVRRNASTLPGLDAARRARRA